MVIPMIFHKEIRNAVIQIISLRKKFKVKPSGYYLSSEVTYLKTESSK